MADLWLISNTQENRQTGGIPGLSLDEWINQQDHLSTLHSNSQTFGLMNPAELEFRQLRVEEVAVIKDAVTAYADRYQLNDTEAKKELTQQALLMVDSGWAAKEHISENPRARALLENLSALEEPLNDWSRDKEFRLFTADTADYNDPYLYANHLGALETPWGGGSGNVFRRQDVEPGWISLYGMEEGQQALEIPGMFDSMGASASTSLNTLGQLWDAGNEQGWGHFMLATGEAVYDSAVLGLSDCMGTTDCLIPDFWDHGSVKERQQVDQLLQHQQGLLDTTGSAYWGGFLLPLELVGPGKAGKEVVATAVDGATTVALRNADILDWDLDLDWLEVNADNGADNNVNPQTANNVSNIDEAFHYTDSKWKESINTSGLRSGSYATPAGNLSPTQAVIELALPPNRNLPNTKLRIDLDAMRKDGYEIPQPTRVSNVVTGGDGRVYTQPGGGYEMKFDYKIPPKYISIVE